eukprot:g48127.t1
MQGLSIYFTISSILLGCFCLFLMRQFSRPHNAFIIKLMVAISWFASFSVCLLLPYDILTDGHDDPALRMLWSIIYWFSYVSTWAGIPLFQSYCDAGDFSLGGKILTAIKDCVVYYLIAGVIGIGFLVAIAVEEKLTEAEVLDICKMLGNIWGITVSVLLMGYGLVELPRTLWRTGDHERALNLVYYTALNIWEDTESMKEELHQTWSLCRLVREKLNAANDVQNLLPLLDRVEETLPALDLYDMSTLGDPVHFTPLSISKKIKKKTLHSKRDIANLNCQAKYIHREIWLIEAQWSSMIDRETELKALIEESKVYPLGTKAQLQWKWKHRWRRGYYRFLTVLCTILSLLLFWSQITLWSKKDLSPFGYMVRHLIDKDKDVQVCLWSLIPLCYLVLCTCFGLWCLKLSKYYRMIGANRTDENSLLFNASWCLRIVAPLGLNFCMIVRVYDTEFFYVVGSMDVPLFGGFTRIVPVLLAVLCTMTYFELFGRLMQCFGGKWFEGTNSKQKANKTLDDNLREGQILLRNQIMHRSRRDKNSTRAPATFSNGRPLRSNKVGVAPDAVEIQDAKKSDLSINIGSARDKHTSRFPTLMMQDRLAANFCSATCGSQSRARESNRLCLSLLSWEQLKKRCGAPEISGTQSVGPPAFSGKSQPVAGFFSKKCRVWELNEGDSPPSEQETLPPSTENEGEEAKTHSNPHKKWRKKEKKLRGWRVGQSQSSTNTGLECMGSCPLLPFSMMGRASFWQTTLSC